MAPWRAVKIQAQPTSTSCKLDRSRPYNVTFVCPAQWSIPAVLKPCLSKANTRKLIGRPRCGHPLLGDHTTRVWRGRTNGFQIFGTVPSHKVNGEEESSTELKEKTLAYHRRGIFDCEWFTRTRYYGVIKPFTMRFGSTGTNSRLLDAHLLWQAQQNRLKPIKTTWENVSTQQRWGCTLRDRSWSWRGPRGRWQV